MTAARLRLGPSVYRNSMSNRARQPFLASTAPTLTIVTYADVPDSIRVIRVHLHANVDAFVVSVVDPVPPLGRDLLRDRTIRQEPSRDSNEFLPTVHGFVFLGNLYHPNAEDDPARPDYPKNIEFRLRSGPSGVVPPPASFCGCLARHGRAFEERDRAYRSGVKGTLSSASTRA
jgi:hypothetical protein